jgi:putative oxygen-independent coproporphyrinogen III oxidase
MRAAPSLYVHTPFCRAKCRYCAFFSVTPTPGALDAYLTALLEEIAFQHARLGRFPAPGAATLFFGGGTPSLLGADALGRILSALREAFGLADDAELTLEANPDSADPEFLAAARRLGVNRLSLGVQSLDDTLLRRLGRVHDARQAVAAARAARAAGFANLGLDLIFGLPGQSVAAWLETLGRALDLQPEHLSCYGLTIEPGAPLARDKTLLAALPDEDAQAEMFLQGAELLAAAGYRHYEISNFARPGRECRHNLACWQGRDCLAFGPAAATTLDGWRRVNPPDLPAWAAAIPQMHPAGAEGGEELTPDVQAREALMLALRTADGLDLAGHHARFGVDLAGERATLLADLGRAGLVVLENGRLRLTRQGMLVSNSVIRALGFDTAAENYS